MTAAGERSGATAVSVIVPAYRAESTLGACLDALLRAGFRREEIVVVDDGSPDATAEVARRAGIEPMTPDGGNRGAAQARNAGVQAAEADILFFVDADVQVHEDVRGRLETFFREQPHYAGVFGSYDDAPAAPAAVSRIRNLLHHHVHQTGPREATTFWTGCGAIRRQDFEAARGFRSEDGVEDVGFGLRLARLGRRIRLDPDLQCKHLKRWTWRSFVRTDYRQRAMPWTRMMLAPENREFAQTLNVSARGKAAVVTAFALVIALGIVPVFPWIGVALAIVSACALALLERSFLSLVGRLGGTRDVLVALVVLWVHYLCAGAGYARVRLFA